MLSPREITMLYFVEEQISLIVLSISVVLTVEASRVSYGRLSY